MVMNPTTTVLPRGIDSLGPDGKVRNTTALFNPMWDRFYQSIADAEGQVPDEQGVTHLKLGGDVGNPSSNTLKALKQAAKI